MVEVSLLALIAWPAVPVIVVFLISLLIVERAPAMVLDKRHALVTGGTSGTGLSVAIKLVKKGVNVTIVARDQVKLDAAIAELTPHAQKAGVKVVAYSADVTKRTDIVNAMKQAEASIGPISLFIHCAGCCKPGYFEELSEADHRFHFDLHYMGAVNCLRYLVPLMKARRDGRIVLVTSLSGLTGIFGVTAYTASKFALRGFAESLHMETSPYNVLVSVVAPPDIDTPGFAEENKRKPEENRLIAEGSGLFTADQIANSVLSVITTWRFLKSDGFDGHALTFLASGTSPASSALMVTAEFCFMGLLRFVSVIYRRYYIHLVEKVKAKRDRGEIRPIGTVEQKSE